MKKTVLKIIAYIAVCLLIPYFITMLMTGNCEDDKALEKVKNVVINYDNTTQLTDMTDYVIRTAAAYYKAEDSAEYLKALAVIVRTYAEYVRNGGAIVNSADIALNTLSQKEMKKLWGDDYEKNYAALSLAINDTEGQVMKCNDNLIIPYFHMVSAGRTRTGDVEYLQGVDCSEDVLCEEYISTAGFSLPEIEGILEKNYPDITIASINEAFQIIDREDSGYVSEVMAGNVTMTGDELAALLGLASSDFVISYDGEKAYFTVKGIGSGYGMSIYNARLKAEGGSTYEEILYFYYKNIQIVNE